MYSKKFLIDVYRQYVRFHGRARGFTPEMIRHWCPIFCQAIDTGLNFEVVAVKKRIREAILLNFDNVSEDDAMNNLEQVNACVVDIEKFYNFLAGKPVYLTRQEKCPQLFLEL
jgi:hypothetical protein